MKIWVDTKLITICIAIIVVGLVAGCGGSSEEVADSSRSPTAVAESSPTAGIDKPVPTTVASKEDAASEPTPAAVIESAPADDVGKSPSTAELSKGDEPSEPTPIAAVTGPAPEIAKKDNSTDSPSVVTNGETLTNSFDPVMRAYIPNTTAVLNGQPNLHASDLKVTALSQAKSVTGHPIETFRDPNQDLELTLGRLLSAARSAGDSPLTDLSAAQDVMDILLGNTEGRIYDGFPMLSINRGAFAPDHVPGEFKMKRLTDTGETIVSQLDGKVHKVWEITINLLWFRQNFESDTFLMRVPFEADPYDELRINWRIYSLIQEDLAPTTILNDGFGRIFHGFDSTFTSIPAFTLSEIAINYPSLMHFRGLYNWGWGLHPPRVAFLQPVLEVNENGDLNPVGLSFATRNRENLTIENISDAAPEKKAYHVAQAALNKAIGSDIAAMLTDPDTSPQGTFREWIRLADDQRQLPPEAWDILAREDGLSQGEFGSYDIVLAFMNNKTFGETPYAQFGTEGKGGVLRDWAQGDVIRVKIINLDNQVHYYRNVDFGAQFSEDIEEAFGNGKFSFEKFNAKPSYGIPKVAEMQWRTGWGFVPHQNIAAQSGVFTRDVDRESLVPFTDQLGESHLGYVFKNVSGYWRFNPPAAIREGDGIPAGDPLREADGTDGVMIGIDTEAFGIAKMPSDEITKHPDQDQFPTLQFPDFLRNPGSGGDIIPPTPKWAPFLVLNPETGTLKAPDGSWWVDQTYFHGRPISAGESIVANVEAPRAGAQLFYQFDPLFHDNSVFSLHPRSDIVR